MWKFYQSTTYSFGTQSHKVGNNRNKVQEYIFCRILNNGYFRFLQADDLYKVIQVAIAVNNRFTSDSDIERFIGLNSAGRQGRYYRLAAEKLGFDL